MQSYALLAVLVVSIVNTGAAQSGKGLVNPERSQAIQIQVLNPEQSHAIHIQAVNSERSHAIQIQVLNPEQSQAIQIQVLNPEQSQAIQIQPRVVRCSYIVVLKVPNIDPKMTNGISGEFYTNMPIQNGLQPCGATPDQEMNQNH